jgi:uncharacterized protein VirK/YbjX
MSQDFQRLLKKYPVLTTIITQRPRAPLNKLLEYLHQEDAKTDLVTEVTMKVAERVWEQFPNEKKALAGAFGKENLLYEVGENLWRLCEAGLEAGVFDLGWFSSSVCVVLR